jgi:hypothetical protein
MNEKCHQLSEKSRENDCVQFTEEESSLLLGSRENNTVQNQPSYGLESQQSRIRDAGEEASGDGKPLFSKGQKEQKNEDATTYWMLLRINKPFALYFFSLMAAHTGE